MFPQRKLLYHRGVDDSVGTYVTDYVLFVQSFLLFVYFLVHFVRQWHSGTSRRKLGFEKSTYAVTALFAFVGLSALVGGLVHQYLQTIEPYEEWNDKISWLLVWRIAAAACGGVSFIFFVLAEHLLTSEKVVEMRVFGLVAYYAVTGMFSLGIVAHSLWMTFDPVDPWSITMTLILAFVSVLIEEIVALIALCKRFTSDPLIEDRKDFEIESLNGTISLTSTENSEMSNKESGTDHRFKDDLNNTDGLLKKRWDLFLHFLATTLLIIGGISQLALAKLANCGEDEHPTTQRCPLPSQFNHNSIFHICQFFVVTIFFAAEKMAIRHRRILVKLKATGYLETKEV